MFDLYILVQLGIPLDNTDHLVWERVTSTWPVINLVGVGFTTYEDFITILAASCTSLVTDTGRVIIKSMSNRHIKIYWDTYIPDCTGNFDQLDETFRIYPVIRL
jgi:hypothetical protein